MKFAADSCLINARSDQVAIQCARRFSLHHPRESMRERERERDATNDLQAMSFSTPPECRKAMRTPAILKEDVATTAKAVDRHRCHHQQYTKDHHISRPSTQATSTRAVHSHIGRTQRNSTPSSRNSKCSWNLTRTRSSWHFRGTEVVWI